MFKGIYRYHFTLGISIYNFATQLPGLPPVARVKNRLVVYLVDIIACTNRKMKQYRGLSSTVNNSTKFTLQSTNNKVLTIHVCSY